MDGAAMEEPAVASRTSATISALDGFEPEAFSIDADERDEAVSIGAGTMLEPDGRFERQLLEAGFGLVAGVDETGRGALAGPLVTAAVILPGDHGIKGLRDSKLLTPGARERLCAEILNTAVAVAIVKVPPRTIDARGLHRSNLRALRQASMRLKPNPQYLLVDGYPIARTPWPSLSIKKGDRVSQAVAAASIVAKVSRDRVMTGLGRRYKRYGFADNKGYGTSEHWDALRAHGPSRHHRLSFSGVGQGSLFEVPR